LVLAVVAMALSGGLILRTIWASPRKEKGVPTAILHVARRPPSILSEARVADEHEADEFRRFKRWQVLLIKSEVVLSEALKDPEITKLDLVRREPDPKEWLRSNLVVAGADDDDELLRISLPGDVPEKSTLVNRVARAYVRAYVESTATERRFRVETLREIYQQYQEQLKEKRSQLMRIGLAAGAEDDSALLANDQAGCLGELRRVRLSGTVSKRPFVRGRWWTIPLGTCSIVGVIP
jgi:polysaccharide biosynthesis transport protein